MARSSAGPPTRSDEGTSYDDERRMRTAPEEGRRLQHRHLSADRVQPCAPSSAQADAVFTFAFDMLEGAINREFCRKTDKDRMGWGVE
jgi:hypothetical protein